MKNLKIGKNVRAFTLLVIILCMASIFCGCGMNKATISYGGPGDFQTGMAEIAYADTVGDVPYPHYVIARVESMSGETKNYGSYTTCKFSIHNTDTGAWIDVPASCMDDISIGTYVYLVKFDSDGGYFWAGLKPDLKMHPVVNDAIAD